MKSKALIPLAALLCAGCLLLAGCAAPDAAPSSADTGDTASTPASTAASVPRQASAPGDYIGEDAAKAAALAHAGLEEADVTFIHVYLDRDDGRQEYEVEFYSGNVEYDYDIDALSGEVLSFDQDAEHISDATAAPAGAYIGEDEAKRIALEAAGLAESEVTALRVTLDDDDGRAEYDVEWYVGRTEYSYEIDAASGSVLSHEMDTDD